MKINSAVEPIMDLPPQWTEGIPDRSDITVRLLSDLVNDEVRYYPGTEVSDSFIYHQPTVESVRALFDKTIRPMVSLIDEEYRDSRNAMENWVLEHYITTRRGEGNIALSFQREQLRLSAKLGRVITPNVVKRSAVHRDHNDSDTDWAIYTALQGESTHVLEGQLQSVFDDIKDQEDVEGSLNCWANKIGLKLDDKIGLDELSRWLFTGIRMGRSALYRLQSHLPTVTEVTLEENRVYEMDGDTVHWRPDFEPIRDRVFFRDIVTKVIDKSINDDAYTKMIDSLQPVGKVDLTQRGVSL